jgi:hypothetical protein
MSCEFKRQTCSDDPLRHRMARRSEAFFSPLFQSVTLNSELATTQGGTRARSFALQPATRNPEPGTCPS